MSDSPWNCQRTLQWSRYSMLRQGLESHALYREENICHVMAGVFLLRECERRAAGTRLFRSFLSGAVEAGEICARRGFFSAFLPFDGSSMTPPPPFFLCAEASADEMNATFLFSIFSAKANHLLNRRGSGKIGRRPSPD
ncbi:hypothetical protein HRR83_000748 [Exophiala dermatitidis]|uniref:Uncharacterized protein n=1 Tax=Exophiala dermatitidis TaxID=5970 RepID=A0AAN6F5S3_EXODE|nr:hypothetical protein HRR74_000752 [Exophiala dermatitidis]KAJ4528630.1 hypothetical protein HRR73_001253 [Exophiala dermatitidis]KAJ4530007.1 hypothetical protein HRR76_009249 [Exophiala dermatitidis]KAJ4558770.1 hypothetical protein HRR77_000750 [Exophiala dermatitidis]KAJ4581202.1 hypothetical protein HRR79_000249 [Exophiala dermatitidis]